MVTVTFISSAASCSWAFAQISCSNCPRTHRQGLHQPSTTLKRKLYDRLARDLVAHFSTKGVAVGTMRLTTLPVDWQSHPKWSIGLWESILPFEEPVDRAAVRSELGIPSDAVVRAQFRPICPRKESLISYPSRPRSCVGLSHAHSH